MSTATTFPTTYNHHWHKQTKMSAEKENMIQPEIAPNAFLLQHNKDSTNLYYYEKLNSNDYHDYNNQYHIYNDSYNYNCTKANSNDKHSYHSSGTINKNNNAQNSNFNMSIKQIIGNSVTNAFPINTPSTDAPLSTTEIMYGCNWPGCRKLFNQVKEWDEHQQSHNIATNLLKTQNVSKKALTTAAFTSIPTLSLNFPSNDDANNQQLMVISRREYLCDVCSKSFSRNYDLKRHQRMHDGIKPFGCECCQRSFSRHDALQRHLRSDYCSPIRKLASYCCKILEERFAISPIKIEASNNHGNQYYQQEVIESNAFIKKKDKVSSLVYIPLSPLNNNHHKL